MNKKDRWRDDDEQMMCDSFEFVEVEGIISSNGRREQEKEEKTDGNGCGEHLWWKILHVMEENRDA